MTDQQSPERCKCGHGKDRHTTASVEDCDQCSCDEFVSQSPERLGEMVENKLSTVKDIYDLLCIHSVYRQGCDGCAVGRLIRRAVIDRTKNLTAQLAAKTAESEVLKSILADVRILYQNDQASPVWKDLLAQIDAALTKEQNND